MPFTQEGRIIKIDTPLGADVLLLQGFTGEEGVSRVFGFNLDLLSETNSAIAPQDILGQKATLTIALPGQKRRYVNGYISHFSQTGRDPRFTYYQARLVPWLWFLGRTSDCRIFQKMSVPDILAKLFQELGFTDFRNALRASYDPPREYCVQYRESTLNFVCRLMEQYGIFYFFEHQSTKHTLVLADSPNAYQSCPEQPRVRFVQNVGELEDEDAISEWGVSYELRPGKCSLTDYNFETPTTDLSASLSSTVRVGGNDRFEVYDYPGEYLKRAEGEGLVKIRMEEEETPYTVARGASNCRAFLSGYRFDLEEHYRRDWNSAWVLTEIRHAATVGGSYHGAEGAPSEQYSNSFACIPAAVPFRPPRLTPRPVVRGPQTAVVVGKSGEEIWVDKYGRVKVQFHWDREGQSNENSSCWVRVSQLWAGKGWGAMWIPRIGQEVIVDFLEGDPDQPIITGRVYNAVEMPPYALPGEQTKSTIKSYSSKGGGGFNEIRFEDKKGKEQIFIYAERNQDLRVKDTAFETIGGERHLVVGKDQFELVKGDKHLHVKGDQNEKVDGTVSLTTGQDYQAKVGMKYALEAGMEIHLKAGMKVVIEAGLQLTLKAAGGFVDIGPAGVTIQGTLVNINSGGAAGAGSGASPASVKDAKEADTGRPGEASQPPARRTRPKPASYSPAALVLREAAQNGTPFCDT
jgi:type VI secretion system secreted protein VgrG